MYHIYVNGIITGSGTGKGTAPAEKKRSEKLINDRYYETLNIDRRAVVLVNSRKKDYEEFKLTGPQAEWTSGAVIAIKKLLTP